MGGPSLYREGARLPEQLARLLFLEPIMAGRRVLEVGAHSDAVARFLLELGAQRVVCASTDRERIDALRDVNRLERVDFRVIRPGVLPGDDGAFDLVIDFTLAEALARGETFRLTDIARLLSQDGFAVTAIESQTVRGLGALLGEPPATAPQTSERSSAGLAASPGPVGYRNLLDALKLQFELVQVYFQSLLLGYLFGSFDVEPSGDGIAPATTLMGSDPEPAGHYLFAFGNAVPVIEDVALVQIPFWQLLESKGLPAPDADATVVPQPALAPAPEVRTVPELPVERVDDAEIVRLRREHAQQERALSQIAARTEELRGEVTQVLTALEQRTRERDELTVLIEGLEAGLLARDAQVLSAHDALAQLSAEVEARGADDAAAADAVARVADQHGALIERIALLEGELVTHASRSRVLEEAHELGVLRIAELEDALLRAESARAALAAQLPELDAAAATQTAQVQALATALDEAREAAIHATHSAEQARAQLAKAQTAAREREQQLEQALFAADGKARELEGEALKLAAGVKALTEERGQAHTRVQDLEARLIEQEVRFKEQVSRAAEVAGQSDSQRTQLEQRLVSVDEELRSARERIDALQKDADGKDKRVKAAHAALEEARRDLTAAREGLQEVAGQRDTLQQVLRARDRELDAARQQLLDVSGEGRKLEEQLEAQKKALSEARERITTGEVERQQLRARTDEQGHKLAETARLHAALEDANKRLTAAEEEGISLLSQLEDVEKARSQAEARAAELERDLVGKLLAEQAAVAREQRARREMADELVQARNQLVEEQARAQADALAQRDALAESLKASEVAEHDLEHRLEAMEQQRGMRDAEVTSLRAILEEAQLTFDRERARAEMLDGTVMELQTVLAVERARTDLHKATLHEARSLLDVERARGDLFSEDLGEASVQLSRERARGDLLKAELDEAQEHIHALRERARQAVAGASARADLQHEVLQEAQVEAREVHNYAALLQAELADARATFQKRKEAYEAAVEAERVRSAAAVNDAQSAQRDLAETRSNAMLRDAELENFQALAASAERERDAVLGDLTAHQARANAEAARRQSIEEELAKLRVAHNQAVAEAQKLKLDAEASKRSAVPELEAQIAAITARLEQAERAVEQKDAKINEQGDLIARLKDRLVRIQDQP